MDGVQATIVPLHAPGLYHKSNGRSFRVRKSTRLTVAGGADEFKVHNSSYNNLLVGVLERVFFVKRDGQYVEPFKPEKEFMYNELAEFSRRFKQRAYPSHPKTLDEFPDEYIGTRKYAIYRNAVETLKRQGPSIKDSYVKIFIKAEKFNYTKKPDAKPRVISPRDVKYNVQLGRYIKHLEKDMCESVDHIFGEKTIVKGLNVVDLGRLMSEKWRKYKNPIAISIDASRFDQHFSYELLQWEHRNYLAYYTGRPRRELRGILRQQLVNKCFGYVKDGTVKYTRRGGRMSGDMNTGLGNCKTMSAMVWSYMRHINVSNYSLANNGDDCVIITERGNLPKIQENIFAYFKRLGFNMVVDNVTDVFERILFCQMSPLDLGDKVVMVRDPRVAISKDVLSIKPYETSRSFQTWLRCVGQGGASLSTGVPVMQEFYQCLIRNSPNYNRKSKLMKDSSMESGFFRLGVGLEAKVGPISERARYSFYLMTDISPQEQLSLENYYQNLNFDTEEGTGFLFNNVLWREL